MSNFSSTASATLLQFPTAQQGIESILARHNSREAQPRQDTVQPGPVPNVEFRLGQVPPTSTAALHSEPTAAVQAQPGVQTTTVHSAQPTAPQTAAQPLVPEQFPPVPEPTGAGANGQASVVSIGTIACVDYFALEALRRMSARYIEIVGREQRILDIKTGILIGRTSFLSQCSGAADLGGFPNIETATARSRDEFKKQRASNKTSADVFIPEVASTPAGRAFLDWPDPDGQWKRTAQMVVVLPVSGGRDAEFDRATQTFNRFPSIWENRPIKPASAMVLRRTTPRDSRIKPLRDHLLFLNDNEELAVDYFILYLAWLYQHPGDHVPWAPLFCTPEKRMGKSMLVHILSDVFGGRGSKLVTSCSGPQLKRTLERGFTETFDNCWLKFVNELPDLHQPEVLDALKSLVTDSRGESEHKGGGASDIQRGLQLILSTNQKSAIPEIASLGRFLVLGTDESPRPASYYEEFARWAGGENHTGPGAQLLADVLWDIGFPPGWDPKSPPPVTTYARHMSEESLPDGALFVRQMVEELRPPFVRDCGEADIAAVTAVQHHAKERGCQGKWVDLLTKNQLGRWMAALGYARLRKRASKDKNENKPRCWRNAEQWNQQPTDALIKHLDPKSDHNGKPWRPFAEK